MRIHTCVKQFVSRSVLQLHYGVLATPSEYRTIGYLFGVAQCTVCVIVHKTVDAIVSKLLTTYITFPTGQALVKVVQGFDEKWNLPQCAGAIDGSHIPAKAPLLNHTDYYSWKDGT